MPILSSLMRRRHAGPNPGGSWTPPAACSVLLLCLACGAAGAASCSASTAGVAFGAYDPQAAVALDSAGDIGVDCDMATGYSIGLSPGNGSYQTRQMTGTGSRLVYNFYTDATRMIVWGDGSQGTQAVAGSGTRAHHTVYGRIPAGQNVQAGSYADNLVVLLAF